jgi:hypothetical protein
MTDETDWGLCLDCATDVAAFLSEGGNGFTTSS